EFKQNYPYLPEEIRELNPQNEQEFDDLLQKFSNISGLDLNVVNQVIPLFDEARDLLQDVGRCSQHALKYGIFHETKSRLHQKYNKQIKEKQALLLDTENALKELKDTRSYEEIGNIILAGIHLLGNDENEVKLPDIYSEGEVSVKLNPKLNPAENA